MTFEDFIGKVVRKMKEKTIQTKVKGTVLYTVISVLMILVVFLMGTLALAATASNRAYGNYQKEQTEATARAVLDSVILTINEDTTSTGIKAKMVALNTGSPPLEVQVTGTDGMAAVAYISNVGERDVYSPSQGKWVKGNIYEVSTTVDKTMAGTTYSAYIVDETKVEEPDDGNGAFVALGDTGGQIGTQGYVAGGTEIGIGNTTLGDYEFNQTTTVQAPFYVNGNLYMHEHATFNFTSLGDFVAIEGDLAYKNALHFTFQDDLVAYWDDLDDELKRNAGGAASDIKEITPVNYTDIPTVYIGGTFTVHPNNAVAIGAADKVPVNVYCGDIDVESGFSLYGDVYAFDETETSTISSNTNLTHLYQWISKTIKDADGIENEVSFGSFISAGSVDFNVGSRSHNVDGELRVAKDVTINGMNNNSVTVGSNDGKKHDLLCGGILSVGAGSRVVVYGDIYASAIVNNGTIECTGNIYTFDVTGNAVYKKNGADTPIALADTTGLTASNSKSTWYDNFSMTKEITSTPYHYTYTYTEYVEQNGVVTSNVVTTRVEPATGSCNAWYFNNNGGLYATVEDAWLAEFPQYQADMDRALTQGEAYKQTVSLYDIQQLLPEPIYPEEFKNEEIRNKVIEIPQAQSYKNFPDTLEKMNDQITIMDVNSNLTIGNCDTSFSAPIETSCIIPSGTYEKNIYIKPASGPIVVVVDDVYMQNGASIIVDESLGSVYFFIRGNFQITNGACLITKDYLELMTGRAWTDAEILAAGKDTFKEVPGKMANELTIAQAQSSTSPYYPNVFIYASDGAKLSLSNGEGFITANIRAPKLSFSQAASNGNINKVIHYLEGTNNYVTYTKNASNATKNGFSVITENITENSTDYTKVTYATATDFNPGTGSGYVQLIGQLICGEIDIANQWGMIYVKSGSNGGGGGGGGGAYIPDRFTVLYYNYY